MNTFQEISSDKLLDDIEKSFRVLAGPGAGKTHWLIQHIQHVIRTSTRLSGLSRIACISYTNTAVKELNRRLGEAAYYVEVSTIHSFLYRNVVKPYLHLLTKEDSTALVNYAEVSGHDEHHPSQAKVRQWLSAIGDGRIAGFKPQFDKLMDLLKKLKWTRSADGKWTIAPLNPIGFGPQLKKVCTAAKLLEYKALYWQEGTIDHDDVLYFAYRILEENPQTREFLAARFRYLFIDEFQDTMPVQAKIVEWLAEHSTIVGVIGDPEQAIYGFLGSSPEHFLNFSLNDFADYRIAGNRRSTAKIVSLLNQVRSDGLKQKSLRNDIGEPPSVFVGDIEKVVPEVRRKFSGATSWILARANERVADIRRAHTMSADSDKWEEFEEADSTRALFMKAIAQATAVAQAQDLAKAVHALSRVLVRKGVFREPLKFDGTITDVAKRAIPLEILEYAISNYDSLAAGTVLAAYDSIVARLELKMPGLKGMRIKGGKPKAFAESMPFGPLLATVPLSNVDEVRDVRSIHQAKGAEVENVCVYLPDANKVSHLFGPTTGQDQEERRITYVAISRARDRVVLCIPSKHADVPRLEAVGFAVHIVN